jgi:hypothetical protein
MSDIDPAIADILAAHIQTMNCKPGSRRHKAALRRIDTLFNEMGVHQLSNFRICGDALPQVMEDAKKRLYRRLDARWAVKQRKAA